MKTKYCPKCQETKQTADFHKNNKSIDGVQHHCKECQKLAVKNNRKAPYNSFIWKQKNKEKYKEYQHNWKADNRELTNEYHKKKYETDLHYQWCHKLRNVIQVMLKFNRASLLCVGSVGCTPEELKKHLDYTGKSRYGKDFDIENYSGNDYHVDHIIGLISFDLTKESERLKANHFSNLQILSREDNLKKNRKFNR